MYRIKWLAQILNHLIHFFWLHLKTYKHKFTSWLNYNLHVKMIYRFTKLFEVDYLRNRRVWNMNEMDESWMLHVRFMDASCVRHGWVMKHRVLLPKWGWLMVMQEKLHSKINSWQSFRHFPRQLSMSTFLLIQTFLSTYNYFVLQHTNGFPNSQHMIMIIFQHV